MSFLLSRFIPVALVATVACAMIATASPASADTTSSIQSCGNVKLESTSKADAGKSFDCFAAAFQRCDQVSLQATGHEPDTAIIWTFVTVNAGRGCAISETVERSVGGAKTTDSYLCNALSNQQDGLHFSDCGPKGGVALRPEDRFSFVLQPLVQQPHS